MPLLVLQPLLKANEDQIVVCAELCSPCALELGNLGPQAPIPDADEKALNSGNSWPLVGKSSIF